MATPKRKLTPKSEVPEKRGRKEPIFREAALCIYPNCGEVLDGLAELEQHAVVVHGATPAKPKPPKEEIERRHLQLSAVWMNVCPWCAKGPLESKEALIQHSIETHEDDLSSFAVELK